MKVYIVLEHKLDEHANVVGTRVIKVCATVQKAESVKEDWEFADSHIVAHLGGDPCVYEIEEREVNEKETAKEKHVQIYNELDNLMNRAPCHGGACVGHLNCEYGVNGCYGS